MAATFLFFSAHTRIITSFYGWKNASSGTKRTCFTDGNCCAVFTICAASRPTRHDPPLVLLSGSFSEISSVPSDFRLSDVKETLSSGNSVLNPAAFSSAVNSPLKCSVSVSLIGVAVIGIVRITGNTASALQSTYLRSSSFQPLFLVGGVRCVLN
jgi:hypothetical protein